MKQKESRKERIIKGEVEGFGREITSFPGGRGSRGMKVAGDFHNMIGKKDFLEKMEETYPPGSYVVFAEKQNKKGYWDYIEATLKSITKEEAYSEEIQDNLSEEKQIMTAEKLEKLKKESNFEHAPGVTEEKVRDLTQADIDMFKAEIQTMEAKILQKEHENVKLHHNAKNIQEALKLSISTQANNILAAEGIIADLEYDKENEVTKKGTENKIDENKSEISRLENNIKVRNAEIANATPDRNERKRIGVYGAI